jgi:hypothetical protein
LISEVLLKLTTINKDGACSRVSAHSRNALWCANFIEADFFRLDIIHVYQSFFQEMRLAGRNAHAV